MTSFIVGLLGLIVMPVGVGFVQGFVEAIRRSQPRLRLVCFDDEK
jgi:hypothetical protein